MRRLLLLFVLAMAVSACADDSGAPLPTPLTTPTPPALSVIVYVLVPRQVHGLTRTSEGTLNAGAVADEKNDQGLAARLTAEGFIHGAEAAYSAPPAAIDPTFTAVTSDALMFTDATGARAYYSEEANRINSIPSGGTLTAMSGVPRQHVDTMIAYASSQPPPKGDEVDRAFIVLMRTGRLVTEIFARGASSANTTAAAFLPLVTAEQQLLAVSPNS